MIVKQTTISEVAEKAGVSTKTVSRVINNEEGVRESTAKKVKKAIEVLNYKPNVFAQSLAGGRTRIIGLIYDNPNPVYISEIMDGVLNYCHKMEYAVIIHPCKFEKRDLTTVMQNLIEKTRMKGMILTPPLSDSKELLRMVSKTRMPYTLISPGSEKIRSDSIITNDYESSKEMVDHIISNGHKRIALIKGHPGHMALKRRTQGYLDALKNAATAALMCVTSIAMAASPFAATALPALNPNQPTQSMEAPIITIVLLCGGRGDTLNPFLVPRYIAATKAPRPQVA